MISKEENQNYLQKRSIISNAKPSRYKILITFIDKDNQSTKMLENSIKNLLDIMNQYGIKKDKITIRSWGNEAMRITFEASINFTIDSFELDKKLRKHNMTLIGNGFSLYKEGEY